MYTPILFPHKLKLKLEFFFLKIFETNALKFNNFILADFNDCVGLGSGWLRSSFFKRHLIYKFMAFNWMYVVLLTTKYYTWPLSILLPTAWKKRVFFRHEAALNRYMHWLETAIYTTYSSWSCLFSFINFRNYYFVVLQAYI